MQKVFKYFIYWCFLIFLPIIVAPYFFKLQSNFLGGGMEKYLSNPYLWQWANFDGEHYLSIAKIGYSNGEQAFFPFYPILIKYLGNNVWSGILISNITFLLALFGLYKLIKLDYSEKVALSTIALLLFFLK